MGGRLYRLSGSSDFAILNFVEVFFSSLSKFSIPGFIPEPSVEHPSAISRAASANRFIDQVKIFFSAVVPLLSVLSLPFTVSWGSYRSGAPSKSVIHYTRWRLSSRFRHV